MINVEKFGKILLGRSLALLGMGTLFFVLGICFVLVEIGSHPHDRTHPCQRDWLVIYFFLKFDTLFQRKKLK
jgi:hypothetical protein